jgi:hypothetical protein
MSWIFRITFINLFALVVSNHSPATFAGASWWGAFILVTFTVDSVTGVGNFTFFDVNTSESTVSGIQILCVSRFTRAVETSIGIVTKTVSNITFIFTVITFVDIRTNFFILWFTIIGEITGNTAALE